MIKLKYLEANKEVALIISDEEGWYTVHEYFKTPEETFNLAIELLEMIEKYSKTDLEWGEE